VAAYIEVHSGEVDVNGQRLVVRNGYHAEREVTTAAGAVAVRAPRVNDKRIDEATGQRCRFSSAILPAWARKSPQMARRCRCCICMACPPATSPRRWSSSWHQPRVVGGHDPRLTGQWKDDARAFAARSLAEVDDV
jgi:putative transposase